jgi:TonB family protein
MKILIAAVLAAFGAAATPAHADAPAPASNFNLNYVLELDAQGGIVKLAPSPSIDLPAVEQAIEAEVRSWNFSAAKVDGQPVPTRTYLRVGVSSPGLDPALTRIVSATTGPGIQSLESPGYPAAALRSGDGGLVVLKLKLDAKGRVRNVAAIPGSSPKRAFIEAAAASARHWRFLPELADGQPVAGAVLIPVCFKAKVPEPQACDWTGPDGQLFKSSSLSVAIQPAARITSELAIASN